MEITSSMSSFFKPRMLLRSLVESFYSTEKNRKKKRKKRNQYLSSVLDWKGGLRDLVGGYDCLLALCLFVHAYDTAFCWECCNDLHLNVILLLAHTYMISSHAQLCRKTSHYMKGHLNSTVVALSYPWDFTL